MDGPDALGIDRLTVRMDGQTVLKDFSLSLQAGRKALLTGPSGCGKSTVLRCLLGFVTPETGSVRIGGEPLTAETVWRLRRHMAYVGQEPDLGVGVVRHILEQPFHYRANAALRGNLGRVPDLFDAFGLARTLLDKSIGDLSGGEKQRVALICALLLDREIFLLDEVTSALDPASKRRVLGYFQSRAEATALFVAHDAEWFSFVDQVIEVSKSHSAGEPRHG
ncbi:MAG: ABC transporter ATP-binding protein [Phycisphaerae bacterium]|nr:ABC transporter ATP-binding protein [Phycisphaerae bacterium]